MRSAVLQNVGKKRLLGIFGFMLLNVDTEHMKSVGSYSDFCGVPGAD